MGAQELITCFEDTLAMSVQGVLSEDTARAVASCRVYGEGFHSARLYAMADAQVQVVKGSAFDAARANLHHGKTAVLNFANPHFPGGGVKSGAVAQEESLCRSSNLYPCLSASGVGEAFYQYHREKTDYFFSDRVLYTKDVTVFKDDALVPALMPQEQWFRVDVITCAAPYLAKRKYTNRAALKEIFVSRIRNILETAIDNEVHVLILGAFGCGAFRNPPEVVAEAFRDVLVEVRYRRAFRRIVFAIRPSAPVCPNLEAFKRVLFGIGEAPEEETREITMPGGRVLSDEADIVRYREWRKRNPYFGKQFSVLGDSISTLEGYNPRGYQLFYQGDACQKTGVREMQDSWWGKVISFFGGELLVNNAWSGSRVTLLRAEAESFPSAVSPRRTGALHIGNVKPDVILVYMGINDWANGVPVSAPEGEDTDFRAAYGHMLSALKENYPNAEVWCCTLAESYMASNPAFKFPSAYGGTELQVYNQAIRDAAAIFGCKLLELNGYQLPYDAVDGTHPTVTGMELLAVLAIRAADPAGSAFLDCEAGRHDNLERMDEKGNYSYLCRRCAHVYTLPAERHKPLVTEPMPAKPVLQLYQKDTGMALRFPGERIFAGRSKDCDLRLTSGYAARYQATFVCRNSVWYVRDNNSKNGTYLNGTRMAPGMEAELKRGDEISFAKQETVVFRPLGE